MTTFRRAATLAAALSLTTALAACGGSDAPGTRITVDTAAGTPSVASAPITSAAQTPASTPLSQIGLRRTDVPARLAAAEAESNTLPDPTAEDALYRCVGVAPTSAQRTAAFASASYGDEMSGVSSRTVRYSSRTPVTAVSTVLGSPRATPCFETYLTVVARTIYDGSIPTSTSVQVLPGGNDGPVNEAGIVSGTFTFPGNSGSRTTLQIGIVYLTGPQIVTQLQVLDFGADRSDELMTSLLFTLARRAATG